VNSGLIGGYADGTFRPEKPVTKAEFISFLNRAFGYTEESAVAFSDVRSTDWFAGEVARAVKAGYVSGYPDGTFRPDAPVSRLEAAMLLHRALHLYRTVLDEATGTLTDISVLTTDEKAAVNALAAKKLMVGSGGLFSPSRVISRAETIAILDRGAGAIYNQAGVCGPETGNSILPGNATITVANVTLRNITVSGDLYITEGVGEGDVTLDNVTVLGRTLIAGCGPHSLNLLGNTNLGQGTIVDRPNGNPHIDDNTGNGGAQTLVFYSSGSYSSEDQRGNPPDVLLPAGMDPGAQVNLTGQFGDLDIETSNGAALNLTGGAAASLNIGGSVQGVTLGLAGTDVGQLNLGGQASLTLTSGSIGEVLIGPGTDGSSLNLEGGNVGQLSLQGQTTVSIAGGTIGNLVIPEGASGSNLVITGGSVNEMNLQGSANLTISGGTLGTLTMAGAGAGATLTIGAGAHIDTLIVPDGVQVITEDGASVGDVVHTPPPNDTTPPVVTANPSGGTYAETIFVELRASKPSTIYYTIDGSTPTTSTSRYTHKIAVYENTTLKYFALDLAGNESGVQTETYVVIVGGGGGGGTPPGLSTNADLSSLVLSAGVLEPAFTPDVTNYAAEVVSEIGSIMVTPTAADSHASVTVNGVVVASGSVSNDIALNPVPNTILVTVTAQDRRVSQTYTITITRTPVITATDAVDGMLMVQLNATPNGIPTPGDFTIYRMVGTEGTLLDAASLLWETGTNRAFLKLPLSPADETDYMASYQVAYKGGPVVVSPTFGVKSTLFGRPLDSLIVVD
jgi:hypothetical protein